MNFDKINKWLTLGANIGVVLGLIILIIEVRQNASLTRATLESAKNDQLANIELSLASPAVAAAWTKSIRAPHTMTDDEIRLVEGFLAAVMLQWDNMFQIEAIGLSSRARTVSHIENSAPYYFGSAYGQNWWRLQKPGWEGTPMMEVAGPIVEGLDQEFTQKYLDASRLPPPTALADIAAADIEDEGRQFMAAYAADLSAGDRHGVAARYHRAGATMIFNGVVSYRSFSDIKERYATNWAPPQSFRWSDLTFSSLSADAVLVVGQFTWGTASAAAEYSYTGILRRDEGALRIILENETQIATIDSETK